MMSIENMDSKDLALFLRDGKYTEDQLEELRENSLILEYYIDEYGEMLLTEYFNIDRYHNLYDYIDKFEYGKDNIDDYNVFSNKLDDRKVIVIC